MGVQYKTVKFLPYQNMFKMKAIHLNAIYLYP